MKRNLLTLFLQLSFLSSFSQENQLAIDQHHLHLDLKVVPDSGKVIGDNTLIFNLINVEVDSITLDAIRMKIKSVSWNSQACGYRNSGKHIRIAVPPYSNAPENDTLRIEYQCNPRKGIYFRGWRPGQGLAQIWTQGQGIDHRHWIPHQDDKTDKLTHSIRFKFSSQYKVASNGILVDRTLDSDSIVWEYSTKQPAPSYLIALAVGEYEVEELVENVTSDESGPAVINYYYPDLKQTSKYYRSVEMMEWLSKEIDVEYPWMGPFREIPVRNFKHGAMENTGCVIIGDIFLQDDRSPFIDRTFLEIEAHEMAHHWFGNYVTARDTRSHWFHEGFASYWQWEGKKHLEEIWMYKRARRQARERVFNLYDQIGPFSIETKKAGSIGFYDKGGWIVSMLIDAMDSNQAKRLISEYLETHAFGLTNSKEFFDFLSSAGVGFSDSYYDFWVNGGEIPIIELKGKSGKWELSDDYGAPMRVNLIGIRKNGAIWKHSLLKLKKTVEFQSPKDVVYMLPDPDDRLLVKWDYEQSIKAKYLVGLPDSILSKMVQLLSDKQLLDVFETLTFASREAGELFPQTIWSLFERWKDREESASRLFEFMLANRGYEKMLDALLLEVPIPQQLSFEKAEIIWQNGTYISMEAFVNWLDSQSHPDLLRYCRELVSYEAPSIQKHAVTASFILHKNDQLDGTDRLLDLASPKQEFVTRTMALNLLINPISPIWEESVFRACMADYFDPNGRIAKPCRQYVKNYLKAINDPSLESLVDKYSINWTSRQREVFQKQTGWTL